MSFPVEIIIAILSSGALSAAISGIFAYAVAKRKKDDAVTAGVRQLLYDRIKYLCKEHISRGFIASNDLEDLRRMHKIYHDELNGNGFLDDLMNTVSRLKIIPAIIERLED
jgi:hypothetical protein